MIRQFSLAAFAVLGLSLALHAQQNDKPKPIQFRAVLHDPISPTAELFYSDPTGAIVPLNFRVKDLSEKLMSLPVNGSLVLYDTEMVDPENPSASLAASVKLPPGAVRVIVVVLPAADGDKPAYRLLLIDDSEKAFPKGESRVIPLIGIDTAIEAGEHRIAVRPGVITRVPPVRRVNEFNMAQTNFHYQQAGAWIAFTERQLQFTDASRRLFIVHATPGAIAPTVSTIVDTSPVAAP